MRPRWCLGFERYERAEETRRESLFGLGNGMLFLRACAPEAAAHALLGGTRFQGAHYPGLYRAGLYNHALREVDGETVPITALVNLPYPFALTLRVDGDPHWFCIDAVELLRYRQFVDMEAATGQRELVFRDAVGRETRLQETRLVSLAQPELALLVWQLTPLNWSGRLHLRSLLPLQAGNAKVGRSLAYEGRHLAVRADPSREGIAVQVHTLDGRERLRIEVQMRLAGQQPNGRGATGAALWQQAECDARCGQALHLELQATIAPPGTVQSWVPWHDGTAAVVAHREAWRGLWERVQLEAPTDPELETCCRFNAFHLLQTASPRSASLDVGLPARGWQEAYFGHIFWDELLAYHFFSLRLPEVTRGWLLYRRRRLAAARDAARRTGLRGAMFPWRSATTGAEETPRYQYIPPSHRWKPDHTRLQHHVGAAIAFNLWHHHLATGDQELLLGATAEMLIEIARFWASIARRPAPGARHEIRGVVGPDEYHDAYPGAARPGLDNNAYTNAMAAWTLCCALDLPRHLARDEWQRLCMATGLQPAELEQWDEVSRNLKLPFTDDGLFTQFDGFGALRPVDAEPLPHRDRHVREDWWLDAQGESVNAYQVTKQADVLMLCHLLGRERCEQLAERLGYRLAPGWYEGTVRHHLGHVSHESSLSRIVCAGSLADVDADLSWAYYRQALHTDWGAQASASTHEGLHLGAMAGTWDVLQRHYLGLRLAPDAVVLQPRPPDALDEVAMSVCVRGAWLRLQLRGRSLRVTHGGGGSEAGLVVQSPQGTCRLEPGAMLEWRCR